jgi:hypothetical protein
MTRIKSRFARAGGKTGEPDKNNEVAEGAKEPRAKKKPGGSRAVSFIQ